MKLMFIAAGFVVFLSGGKVAAEYVEGNAPFINTWMVKGLLPYEQSVDINNIDLSTWKYFDDRLFSRNLDNYQDIRSYYKIKRGESIGNKSVYAHVYVYSESAQTAQLRVGVHNEVKVWLNGDFVGQHKANLNAPMIFTLEKEGGDLPGSANLIAHYDFEDNVNDSSSNAYHGTVNGTASYVTGSGRGGNKAFSFDGGTYIDLPSATVSGLNQEVTISWWQKVPNISQTGGLFSGQVATDDSYPIALFFPWNNMLYFYTKDDYLQESGSAGNVFLFDGGFYSRIHHRLFGDLQGAVQHGSPAASRRVSSRGRRYPA